MVNLRNIEDAKDYQKNRSILYEKVVDQLNQIEINEDFDNQFSNKSISIILHCIKSIFQVKMNEDEKIFLFDLNILQLN